MPPLNRRVCILVACSTALAGCAAALALFAGFTTASPKTNRLGKSLAAVEVAAPVLASQFGPAVSAAHKVLAVRRFPPDKRQPRPPRHRSERATSYTAELELAASVIHSITHDHNHRPFLAEFMLASPLSGHPLDLLRPPAA